MYIHIYKDNPTAGGTNGTLCSEGTGTTPVSVGPLNATNNEESSPIKLSTRCDTGFKTSGSTTLTPVGPTASKWAFAPDSAGSPGAFGAYGASLTIGSEITAVNTVFWVKAKATSDEDPSNDTTVDIQISAVIAAS